MVTYLGSLIQLCCGEGGTLQTNITGMCGECSQCMDHTGFAQAHSMFFLVLHCSGCRVLCRALSKVDPVFHVLPSLSRSGSWVFCKGTDPDGLWVLCPSQVQTAQATSCLASALSQVGLASYALSNLGDSVSWVHHEGTVPGVPCISSGELISGCDTPGGCEPSRIPGRHG